MPKLNRPDPRPVAASCPRLPCRATSPPPRIRGRHETVEGLFWRSALGVFLLAVCLAPWGAVAAPTPVDGLPLKIYVDHPGVYSLELGLKAAAEVQRGTARLEVRGRDVPMWLEPTSGDEAPRLGFVVGTELFRPDDLRDAEPLRVLQLFDEGMPPEGEAARATPGPSGGPRRVEAARSKVARSEAADSLPAAQVYRRVLLEQDVIRAALPMGEEALADTLWYWAMLTPLGSSDLELDLGFLGDRPTAPELDARITVHALGWSRSKTPEGMPQHQLDAWLGDQLVGSAQWDGRERLELGVDLSTVGDFEGPARLKLKIPERIPPGETDPLIDVTYIDRVEVRYRPTSPLAGSAVNGDPVPLVVGSSTEARWLADPAGSPVSAPASLLVTAAGMRLPRDPAGGWVLPPLAEETELWIVDRGSPRPPLAVEPSLRGTLSLPPDLDDLIVAPPDLVEGAERLAEIHRARGLRVAVVSSRAVFDQFGGGEESPRGLRRFLQEQYERSARLRYVLLVGDADWFVADDRLPYLERPERERNRIPSWTYLSTYGVGASDHYYAMDPEDEAKPRFAIGRLPASDRASLDGYISKVQAWLAAPKGSGAPTVVMASDISRGSQLRQRRLIEQLTGLPLSVVTPLADLGGRDPDTAMIDALDRKPGLVYFGGHGSRFTLQLGEPDSPSPETFFDLDDIQRLTPVQRQPFVVAASCATAPFDHPQADSLGEEMVLSGERGAVAFVGASSSLSTPRTFGEGMIRGWLEEKTLGDAFVAAKRRTGSAQASHLYNFLGDPTLPAQGPEGRGQQE
ncbi:MAG: hypothetical protein KDD11_12810 [Acidobacteria bacterium]|nr:hypothetical protein [Acidobacteriota bacterium]